MQSYLFDRVFNQSDVVACLTNGSIGESLIGNGAFNLEGGYFKHHIDTAY